MSMQWTLWRKSLLNGHEWLTLARATQGVHVF
jgi:hypothetical protein